MRTPQVTNGTVGAGYYAYDGLGRRVEAVDASSVLFDSYHGTDILAEQNIYGYATDHVFAPNFIATDGDFISRSYYYADALGSVRLVTDNTANIVFSDNYQPFGQDNGTPNGSQTYRFTGKPVSQTTGLYYEYSQ